MCAIGSTADRLAGKSGGTEELVDEPRAPRDSLPRLTPIFVPTGPDYLARVTSSDAGLPALQPSRTHASSAPASIAPALPLFAARCYLLHACDSGHSPSLALCMEFRAASGLRTLAPSRGRRADSRFSANPFGARDQFGRSFSSSESLIDPC
jgi:hypothetical protein